MKLLKGASVDAIHKLFACAVCVLVDQQWVEERILDDMERV